MNPVTYQFNADQLDQFVRGVVHNAMKWRAQNTSDYTECSDREWFARVVLPVLLPTLGNRSTRGEDADGIGSAWK